MAISPSHSLSRCLFLCFFLCLFLCILSVTVSLCLSLSFSHSMCLSLSVCLLCLSLPLSLPLCLFFLYCYSITVVPIFPFALIHPAHAPLLQSIFTPLSMSMGHSYMSLPFISTIIPLSLPVSFFVFLCLFLTLSHLSPFISSPIPFSFVNCVKKYFT